MWLDERRQWSVRIDQLCNCNVWYFINCVCVFQFSSSMVLTPTSEILTASQLWIWQTLQPRLCSLVIHYSVYIHKHTHTKTLFCFMIVCFFQVSIRKMSCWRQRGECVSYGMCKWSTVSYACCLTLCVCFLLRSGNEDKLMALLTPLNVNCHASDGRKVTTHKHTWSWWDVVVRSHFVRITHWALILSLF